MDKGVMDKLIEMIRGDLTGVSISKKVDSVFTSVTFRYDKENEVVSYESSVYDNKTKDRKEDKGVITNVDQIVTLVTRMGLESKLIEVVKSRFEKEERVLRVKQSMLDRIKNMDLLPIEKQVLLEIVEQTCQLSEVVGNGNRVIINQIPDMFDQVRLTDHTCWDDNGGKLHLQLVQTITDSSGTNHRSYPRMSFEELVGIILDSQLLKAKVAATKKV